MTIAFYAPMKAPDHARPSGDRLIGQLLMRALESAGYSVELASRLRARDGKGDAGIQHSIRRAAELERARIITEYEHSGPPDAWFSYHLFHKAPDWIGPEVAAHFDIPYIVAEASYAPKQAGGPWNLGHERVADCLAQAHGVVVLNPDDISCVRPLLRHGARVVHLPAFLDTEAFAPAGDRTDARHKLASRMQLEAGKLWIITVAMMREGDKLKSYTELATALRTVVDNTWQLLVIGDGSKKAQVQALFADFPRECVVFLGQRTDKEISAVLGAADLFVWPAVNEAIGMAMLEAQACGLPVISANTAGVATVVEHERSGLLCAPGDIAEISSAIKLLIASTDRRSTMAFAARRRVLASHSITSAGQRLRVLLALL